MKIPCDTKIHALNFCSSEATLFYQILFSRARFPYMARYKKHGYDETKLESLEIKLLSREEFIVAEVMEA